MDAGQVWWMLFASRWETDTVVAAVDLKFCLGRYWLDGNPGGLASPYCNAANAGLLKNKDRLRKDVTAYAIYLLTGKTPSGFAQTLIVPRWTMNDAS